MDNRAPHRSPFSFLSRLLAFLLFLSTLLLCTAGCAFYDTTEEDGRYHVVCTTFPHYDWMRNIIGDSQGIRLTLLIGNGTDPHSYEPTIADIATLSKCDAVILVGGESDRWIEDALANDETPPVRLALSTLPDVTLREMTSESGGDHGHTHKHNEHDHTSIYDEHIWLSLSNAQACTRGLTDFLCKVRAQDAARYRRNAETYLTTLKELDEQYRTAVREAPRHELVFADRFPFLYLTEDYGLHVHAAFDGCTTDVNASFETILRLAKIANQWSVTKLLTTETSNGELASAVARACSREQVEILALDSLQAITLRRIQNGETYLSIMKKNLLLLKQALS